ncbi:MAG: hypothetical protein AABW99_02670 [archaeon]
MRWGSITLVFLALFVANAGALISGFPDSITIGETPAQIAFTVENNSGIRQPISVQAVFPSDYKIDAPKYAEANSSAIVKITVYPQKGLEGSTQKGVVSIDVANNLAEKNILVNYAYKDECTVTIDAQNGSDGKIILEMENASYKSKTARLVSLEKAPQDWNISGNTEFTIGAYEKRAFETKLAQNSAFEGNIELVFSCSGKTIAKEIKVKRDEQGALAGLATIGSMFENTGDTGFIIDAFLVIIAAILMIAFIARLVKILNTGNQTKLRVKK